MGSKIRLQAVGLLVLAAVTALLPACGESEPIRLGFVAGLSGRVADLGVAGRNGVILAVEAANQAGGVNGRPVELVVRDDQQNPDIARKVVRELLDQEVTAIIGPMTSSMAMEMVPIVNQSSTIMVSPTATTTKLLGLDDNFLRVISSTRAYASKCARYQAQKLGRRTAVAIYDLNNRAYTQSWLDDFRSEFHKQGGKFLKVHGFHSGDNSIFLEVTRDLLAFKPDVFLIISNAVDAALISQQVHKLDPGQAIVMSEWASTERYMELAGTASEGVYVAQFIDRHDTSARYQDFRKAYRERFSQEPGFAGLAGYDAGLVVLAGLAGTGDGRSLKDMLIKQRSFQGVQQEIIIDRYGDANRATFITTIRDKQYVTIE
jgi:branched-chain amino acid transport system substrate-binding protein